MDRYRFAIRVDCHAGYRGEETPRQFFIKDRRIGITEIIDRWLAPDYRYFKVRGDDGARYIIRHDVETGHWELTMFEHS
jgi:hypothetical protein